MGTHQNTPPRLLLGQREGNQPDGIFLFQAWQGWVLCCRFCSQGGTAARGGADPRWGTRHRGGQGWLHGQGEAAGCCLPVSASPTQQPQHPKTHPGLCSPGSFQSPPSPAVLCAWQGGRTSSKTPMAAKGELERKKKKATKEKNPVRAARRIACTGEKRSTAVDVQRSRACTNQSSTRSSLNWPSPQRWPSAQPCLPWGPEAVLYLIRGATEISHPVFTAAHVRTCPESPRCVGQVGVPGTEPPAQGCAAEACWLPSEPAPAACQLCRSCWRNLQP